MYRVPTRLVPVCVFNGSLNRETEEGSVRQGLNVLQYYNSAGYEQTVCAVVGGQASVRCLPLVGFRRSRSSVHLSAD